MASTISDVAKRAGVSPNTVSRVINGAENVRPEILERVNRAIEELDYVPNAVARSLRSKRTRWLAVVVPDVTNSHWHNVARGVEDAAQSRGYAVLLCNTDDNPLKQRRYLEVAASQSVAGVIVAPSNPDARQLLPLRTSNIPTVCVNRRITGWEVDTAYSDARSAAWSLTRRLISVGHQQITVITGPTYHSAVQDRLAGYKIALAEAGLPYDPALIKSGEFHAASAETLTYRVLDETPQTTAILAANKNIAMGVIQALGKRGLRIPQDMALVSFGDLEEAYFPFLTCILEPAYEMGANAAQLLFSRLESDEKLPPRQVVLPTRLVVRYSCGRLVGEGADPGLTLTIPGLEDPAPVLVKALTAGQLAQYAPIVAHQEKKAETSWEEKTSFQQPDVKRVLRALRHQTPDRLPYLGLWRPDKGLVEFAVDGKPYPAPGQNSRTETPATPEEHVAFARRLGMDAVACTYAGHLKSDTVHGWSDLDRLEQPPSLAGHLTLLEQYLRAAQGTGVGIAAGFPLCLYEAMRAVGLSSAADLARQDRRLLETLMDILAEQQERVIRAVCDRFSNDLAFIAFHDPVPSFLSPNSNRALLRELLPKCAGQLLQVAEAYEKPVLLHVKGDLDGLIPTLHNLGVETIYAEALAPDLALDLKTQWRAEVALVGALPVELLLRGDHQAIERTIQATARKLAQGGGYILSLPSPTAAYPASAMIAVSDAVRRPSIQGKRE